MGGLVELDRALGILAEHAVTQLMILPRMLPSASIS